MVGSTKQQQFFSNNNFKLDQSNRRSLNTPTPRLKRQVSGRMNALGTETAYAVSGEAAAWAAKGNEVFNFHIGDIDIRTPQVVKEAAAKAMMAGHTGYCPAAGIMPLREALAQVEGEKRGIVLSTDNISVQTGGKPTIGKFLWTTVNIGDEVLYPSPGYPIYESHINFIGARAVPYSYKETKDGFIIDFADLKSKITKSTKALIYNNYQNPTGAVSSRAEMMEISMLANQHDLWVLSDEAYFDLTYDGIKPTSILTIPGMFARTVVLQTFSKGFAMTGWRLGCAIGPKELMDGITKLNVNEEGCTAHFIQHAGVVALTHPEAKEFTETLKGKLVARRDTLHELINQIPGFSAPKPKSAFYLFVNCTEAMRKKGVLEYEHFRKLMMKETGVAVCTREHFGEPLYGEKDFYIRFAYSGTDVPVIEEAMKRLKNWILN